MDFINTSHPAIVKDEAYLSIKTEITEKFTEKVFVLKLMSTSMYAFVMSVVATSMSKPQLVPSN